MFSLQFIYYIFIFSTIVAILPIRKYFHYMCNIAKYRNVELWIK